MKNRTGYLQLCELLSKAWLTNLHRGRAEIRAEWLEELQGSGQPAGLIALSGAHFGDVGHGDRQWQSGIGGTLRTRVGREFFRSHFYIEVQRAGQPNMENHVRQAVTLAAKLQLPVVATHPMQFLTQEEFTAHEARTCIAEGEILANARRVKRFNDQQCFKTQAEMAALFADMPAALQNTMEIAKRCNLQLELGKPKLPNFPTPDGMTIDDFLVMQAKEGLELRLSSCIPDEAVREKERAAL